MDLVWLSFAGCASLECGSPACQPWPDVGQHGACL